MASLIESLICNLEEQLAIFEKLLDLSLKKKDIIINNNIESLLKITPQENTLVGRNKNLDKAKNIILKDIAEVLNRKASDFNVPLLIELLEGNPAKDELLELNSKIKTVMLELKDINSYNKILVGKSLQYIDFSINLIRGQLSGAPQYLSAKGKELDLNKHFFDAKQ